MNKQQSQYEKHIHYFLLLLIPFILCYSSTEWMFTKLGFIDPFVYMGYSIHYSDPSFHNWVYKIARLPWILYQFVAYKTFGSFYSAYFIQISCQLIAILFTYKALSRLLKPMSAFFGAALLGFLTIFHGSGGADYHNTLAGPLYAVSFYYFLRAIQERTKRLYIIFGIVITLTIHTNITMINLIPGLIFIWYSLSPEDFNRKNVMGVVKYSFYGALSITLLLSFIQLSVGRTPFFFLTILKLVGAFVTDSSRQISWWQPWTSLWFLKEDFIYILLYLTTGIFSVVTLTLTWVHNKYHVNKKFLTNQRILIASYLVSLSIFLIWQTMGHTVLQPDYFAYVLIMPMIGAIAGMFDEIQLDDNKVLKLFLPFLIVAGFTIFLIFETPLSISLNEAINSRVTLVISLWSVSFTVLLFGRSLQGVLIFLPLLMGLANAEYNAASYRETNEPFSKWGRGAIIEAHLKLMSEADQFFKDRPPVPQVRIENPTFYDKVKCLLSKDKGYFFRIKTWFNSDDTLVINDKILELNKYAASLSSTGITYLSGLPLKPIMDIPIEDLQKAYDGKDLIVLITTSKKPLKDLQNRVQAMGKKLEKIERFTVPFGPAEIPFELVTITD